MSFTLVTALININRENWKNFDRKWEQYLTYMSNILKMDVPMCIYIEENLLEFVSNHRKNFEQTKIVLIKIDDYKIYEKLEKIQNIQNSDKYKNLCVDKFCPEVCIPLYNITVNNKVDFLFKTAKDNPFITDKFIWLDAGYGHCKFNIPDKYKWDPKMYLELADKNKIVINTLLDKPCNENYLDFFIEHEDFIDGGLVVGNKETIIKFHEIYYNLINEIIDKDIIDDDQYFMTMAYINNKDMFNLVKIPSWEYRKNIILS
jgi:protein YibB